MDDNKLIILRPSRFCAMRMRCLSSAAAGLILAAVAVVCMFKFYQNSSKPSPISPDSLLSNFFNGHQSKIGLLMSKLSTDSDSNIANPGNEDEVPEMAVHWHKKPYRLRNRISPDQEGKWKVRWSREDDPDMAGRMDDARWNILHKLGQMGQSSQHDNIPAVPYYERMLDMESESPNHGDDEQQVEEPSAPIRQ